LIANADGTGRFVEKFTKLGLSKRETIVGVYYDKLLEKIKLMMYDPYVEEYFFDMIDIY